MDQTQALNKIQNIFRDITDTPNLSIDLTSTPDTVPGWDSIANVNIVFAIEEDFGVKFEVQDLQKIKSVADFLVILSNKTNH